MNSPENEGQGRLFWLSLRAMARVRAEKEGQGLGPIAGPKDQERGQGQGPRAWIYCEPRAKAKTTTLAESTGKVLRRGAIDVR